MSKVNNESRIAIDQMIMDGKSTEEIIRLYSVSRPYINDRRRRLNDKHARTFVKLLAKQLEEGATQ